MTSSSKLEWPESPVVEFWRETFEMPDRQDIKSLAKYLCKAHSQKRISDETLTLLLEYLLSFYLEKRIEERISRKSAEFDRRLMRIFTKMMVFE
jgi:hypothetical protein